MACNHRQTFIDSHFKYPIFCALITIFYNFIHFTNQKRFFQVFNGFSIDFSLVQRVWFFDIFVIFYSFARNSRANIYYAWLVI